MHFTYTAVSKDHKRVDGTMNAENVREARQKLHGMELAVLHIEEISEETLHEQKTTNIPSPPSENVPPPAPPSPTILPSEAPSSEIPSSESVSPEPPAPAPPPQPSTSAPSLLFWFSAADTSSKLVEGTIDAIDALSAYSRLIDEFSFSVQELRSNDKTGPLEDIPTLENQRILQQAANQKEEKEEDSSSFASASTSDKNLEEEAVVSEEFRKEKQALNTIVVKLLGKIQDVLAEYEGIISSSEVKNIEEIINALMRVKDSNNLATISKSISEVLSALAKELERITTANTDKKIVNQSIKDFNTFEKVKKTFLHAANSQTLQKSAPEILGIIEGVKVKIGAPSWLAPILYLMSPHHLKSAPAAIKELGEKISALLRKEFFYLLRSWWGPKKELKELAKERYQEIKEERKKLQEKYDTSSETFSKEEQKEKGESFLELLQDFQRLVAWLLTFYITYFAIASLLFTKDLPFSFDFIWKTISSTLLISIVFGLFVLNGVLTLKIKVFPYNTIATIGLFLIACSTIFLFVLNF